MIKKLLISLFIGLATTLFIAQYDPWVLQRVGDVLKQELEVALDCTLSFEVKSINFFMPEVIVETVEAHEKNAGQWSWKCSQYASGFSWFDLLFRGSAELWAQMCNLELQTNMHDKTLAIAPHVAKLFETPMLPFRAFVKSVSLQKAQVRITDDQTKLDSMFIFKSESKKVGDEYKTTINFIDGHLSSFGRTCFEHFAGNIKLDTVQNEVGGTIAGRLECNGEMPQLGQDKICLLTGTWEGGHGRFALRNLDHSFVVDPIIITKQNEQPLVRINTRLPLALLWRFAVGDVHDKNVQGQVHMYLQTSFGDNQQSDGHVIIEEVRYKSRQVCTAAKISGFQRNKKWQGTLSARINHTAELSGSFNWHEETNIGLAHITNNNMISMPQAPYWFVGPKDLQINVTSNAHAITSSHDCIARSRVRDVTMVSHGDITISENKIQAMGNIDQHTYQLNATTYPLFMLEKFIYADAHGAPLLTLQEESALVKNTHISTNNTKKHIEGSIYYPLVRSLLINIFEYDLQGEGVLHFTSFLDSNKITLKAHLADGTIRLPQTYNFVDGFDTQLVCDLDKNMVTINSMRCSLHGGSITSKHGVLYFNKKGEITFAHVPVQLNQCMLNVNRDLFAMVSGALLLHKQSDELPFFQGRIILERAQLKENILSDAFQKQLFQFTGNVFDVRSTDVACDVTLQTKYPIRIDTAFLEASAKVDLTIKRRISDPEVTGSISLLSGSLKFPYKSLYINKGSIYFLPDQLYNPMIEVCARNKIKQYNVSLYVTGSLQNHHVLLESTPPLSEEQLISLLLIGSQQESLNAMMPALLMQNMQHVIFGSDQSFLLDKYFNRLPRLFSIHLVPSFTDQTGRGGLRGALEIDVSERWRALIQKNFSLTEDTRFELEYLLSDDITLRAIRDERRDVGGEVEMRWKF